MSTQFKGQLCAATATLLTACGAATFFAIIYLAVYGEQYMLTNDGAFSLVVIMLSFFALAVVFACEGDAFTTTHVEEVKAQQAAADQAYMNEVNDRIQAYWQLVGQGLSSDLANRLVDAGFYTMEAALDVELQYNERGASYSKELSDILEAYYDAMEATAYEGDEDQKHYAYAMMNEPVEATFMPWE
jgi:hypothetical protein